MAIVTYFLPKDAPLTEEEKAEIAALEGRPIVYDEDCMPMSEDRWQEVQYIMRKYKTRRVTREMWRKEFPARFQNRNVD